MCARGADALAPAYERRTMCTVAVVIEFVVSFYSLHVDVSYSGVGVS
jgi:hypothetical protein